MFAKVCIAVAITLGLMFIIWLVKNMMLTPVQPGRNTKISIVIKASGNCPELENVLESALWLIHSGAVEGKILLADAGLDHDSRYVAELLCHDTARIIITTPEECSQHI